MAREKDRPDACPLVRMTDHIRCDDLDEGNVPGEEIPRENQRCRVSSAACCRVHRKQEFIEDLIPKQRREGEVTIRRDGEIKSFRNSEKFREIDR